MSPEYQVFLDALFANVERLEQVERELRVARDAVTHAMTFHSLAMTARESHLEIKELAMSGALGDTVAAMKAIDSVAAFLADEPPVVKG